MEIVRVPIDSLVPDPENARFHPEENLEAIRRSIARFGQVSPLVVHNESSIVVSGNGTLEAMRRLGMTECDVVVYEGSQDEARALAIVMNRSAETSTWDEKRLSQTLSELKAQGFTGMDSLGFDPRLLDAAIAGFGTRLVQFEASLMEKGVDEDQVPEPPDTPTTKRGDIWILGPHRLMCGDSCLPEDLDRLLDGATIQLLNTDPPYNVNVEPRSNNALAAGASHALPLLKEGKQVDFHQQRFDMGRNGKPKKTSQKMRAKDRPLKNDFMTDADFDKKLLAWFGNAARVMDVGRSFYVWGGYANWTNYPPALKASGFYFSQGIQWVKKHPVLGRKDFMNDCESCFYGWKEGGPHYFNPEITNATNVWEVKKVTPQNMVHLTEKPVELAYRAMIYSSKGGDNVLDLFGGSGSTMMGADKAGRVAFSMEMDEAYCDVIVERWQNATGGKAKRA